jgi:ATP-dependent Clp protease ATP-binding subunit ClpA
MEPALSERERWERYLSGLGCYLKKHLLGQDEALSRVARGVRSAVLGLNGPSFNPLASFLLLGPTGVGKTQTAKLVAEYIYGAGTQLEMIFLNEFPVESKFGDFIAQLETAVLRNPQGTTILFDEIEKGFFGVMDVFVSLLEEGVLTTKKGRLSVGNFILILTSNLGSSDLALMENSAYATMERQVLEVGRQYLRPELFNRIDDRIVYRPLGHEIQKKIIARLIEDKLAILSQKAGHLLSYDREPVEAFLFRVNRKGGQGARSLKLEVDRQFNRAFLEQKGGRGSNFCYDSAGGHLVLT